MKILVIHNKHKKAVKKTTNNGIKINPIKRILGFLLFIGLFFSIFLFSGMFLLTLFADYQYNLYLKKGIPYNATILDKEESTSIFISSGPLPITNYYLKLCIHSLKNKIVFVPITFDLYKSRSKFPIGSQVLVYEYDDDFILKYEEDIGSYNHSLWSFPVIIISLISILIIFYKRNKKLLEPLIHRSIHKVTANTENIS